MEPAKSSSSAVTVLVTVIIVIIIAAAYYFGWVRRANVEAPANEDKAGVNIQIGGETQSSGSSQQPAPNTY